MSNLALYGNDLFGDEIKQESSGPVADKFTFPPFSILDAKSGYWQERKRAWLSMGIKGEEGRDCKHGEANACITNTVHLEKFSNTSETMRRMKEIGSGASVFDPVLTELAYRWWCPEGGQIVDPFAGGSVRGIVASALNKKYWGSDISERQIYANRQQHIDIGLTGHAAEWVIGDSMKTLDSAPDADFIFSCPPYGDLEKYSDHPDDISNMEWHTFLAAYRRIILKSVTKMKDDSFACFVVGDFRDKKGFYRNFVGETVNAFEMAGARFYNDAILATPIGTACMRVTIHFKGGRKLSKIHQNVLVFCKGDWKKATQKCGDFS